MTKAFALATAWLFLSQAVAGADETTFTTNAAKLGYDNPQEALSAGYAVCAMRSEVSPSAATRLLQMALNRINPGTDPATADAFNTLAVTQLCPNRA